MTLRSILIVIFFLQACGAPHPSAIQAAASETFNADAIFAAVDNGQSRAERSALFDHIGSLSLSSYFDLVSESTKLPLQDSRDAFLSLGDSYANIRALWSAAGLVDPTAITEADFRAGLSSLMETKEESSSLALLDTTTTSSSSTSTTTTVGTDGCAESKAVVTHSIASACFASNLSAEQAVALHCGDVAALSTQRVTTCIKVNAKGQSITETSVAGTPTGTVGGGSQRSGLQDLGSRPYSGATAQAQPGFNDGN